MTLTPDEWETELESVEQVAARDTIPAPPPTEPAHEPLELEPMQNGDQCVYCGELFEHDPACPLATVIS